MNDQIEEIHLPQSSARSFKSAKTAFDDSDSAIEEDLPPVIPLNVGGCKYMTRISTLRRFPESMLAAMFSGRHRLDKDKDGNFFIDGDGHAFQYILGYLRNDTLPPPDVTLKVYHEAMYLNIEKLVEELQFSPDVCRFMVKQQHRLLFPNYCDLKKKVIQTAVKKSIVDKHCDLFVHVFKDEFVVTSTYFKKEHECIIEQADICYGPWGSGATEDQLMHSLQTDLMEEGFHIRPYEQRRKCKYYAGQSCPNCVWKVGFVFA